MNFIKKFFSSKTKTYENQLDKAVEGPSKKLPLDEMFVHNFVKKGGRFFYPENMEDFRLELLKLLKYLKLQKFGVIENSYALFLNKLHIPVTTDWKKAGILLGGCEYLIAQEGAILTTAQNSQSWRNHELPHRRVIIALANQIVAHKTDALIKINNKYKKPPANIQTMSIFAQSKDDLLGGKWYETYLFLIEN